MDTGKSGRVVLKEYSLQTQKSQQWKKDVAKSKASKLFKQALETLREHPIIVSMINNNVFDVKDIMHNSVSGALTKLSKQMATSLTIDSQKEEIDRLNKLLESRPEKEDWKLTVKELKREGKSLREMEKITGKAKSTISDYLTKESK